MSKKVRLAENIRIHLQSRGLTVSQTADKVGMNKATLHNYSNGVVPRNLISLLKLSDFLGISLLELIYGSSATSEVRPATEKRTNKFILTIEPLDDDHDDH